MNIATTTTDIATWSTVIIQFGLLVAAIFALRQIKVSKDGNIQTEKRAALSFTMVEIDKFRELLSGELMTILNTLREKNLKLERIKLKEFTEEELKMEMENNNRGVQNAVNNYKLFVEKTDNETFKTIGKTMNKFEVMATGFVTNLGNKKVAYPIIGPEFCKFVESHFPRYCGNRSKDQTYFYTSTISLYKEWAGQLRKDNLENKKKDIEEELSKIGG